MGYTDQEDVNSLMATYRNTNTVNAKITETQDSRAVSDDADLRVGAGPVAKHGSDRLSLLDRNV